MNTPLFLIHAPPGAGADACRQLHREGLQAALHGHWFRGRLADATRHGASGDRPDAARRGGPLLVRHRHPHVGGLPVLRQVPGRGAHRGVRRRGWHSEPAQCCAVQALDRKAEAACDAERAAGERACQHAAELHHRGLHQERAVLPVTLTQSGWVRRRTSSLVKQQQHTRIHTVSVRRRAFLPR